MKIINHTIVFIIFAAIFLFSQDDRLNEAKKYIEKRELDLAKPILESLYDQDVENPEVNYWFGVYSLIRNNYDDAIDYLDVAIEGNKTNPDYYNMLGNAYGMKAQNAGVFKAAFAAPKAKSNWEKAIELKPDFVNAKIALFQYYLNAPGVLGGDYEKAKQIAQEFLNTHPALGHSYLANYYLIADNDFEKAEKELQESLKINPSDSLYAQVVGGNVGLLNRMGYRHLNNKNYPESRKAFKLAIKLAPDQANPYDSMGDYYAAQTQYDSALINYDKAAKQDSNFAISKFNKGKMLEKLNRLEEAKVVYKDILKNNAESDYADDAEDRLDELE